MNFAGTVSSSSYRTLNNAYNCSNTTIEHYDFNAKTVPFGIRQTVHSTTPSGYQGKDTGYNVATPIPGEPVRFGETVQRVWIAPYEDASKNYHEPSYIYAVLDKSHWVGLPVKSVTSDSTGD